MHKGPLPSDVPAPLLSPLPRALLLCPLPRARFQCALVSPSLRTSPTPRAVREGLLLRGFPRASELISDTTWPRRVFSKNFSASSQPCTVLASLRKPCACVCRARDSLWIFLTGSSNPCIACTAVEPCSLRRSEFVLARIRCPCHGAVFWAGKIVPVSALSLSRRNVLPLVRPFQRSGQNRDSGPIVVPPPAPALKGLCSLSLMRAESNKVHRRGRSHDLFMFLES